MNSQLLFTCAIGLIAAERIVELFISRRNAARAFARGAIEVGQGHFRAMTIFHTLFLIGCVAEVWLLQRTFDSTLGWVMVALTVAAQGLRYWAISTLGEHWNTRVIVQPRTTPISSGPYRFVRHPNYVAVIVEMFSVPLMHGAWLTALIASVVNAVILSVRIRVEEEALGPKYAETFHRRGRFFPGVH